MFFLMGLLAVAGVYLMDRASGEKEAWKSAKIVLLVFLFLLWLVLWPFLGMATMMAVSDVSVEQGMAAQYKIWGEIALPFLLACCWTCFRQRRTGAIDWKKVLRPLKIYLVLLLFIEILPIWLVDLLL